MLEEDDSSGTIVSNTTDLEIAKPPGGKSYFPGVLDDVRIYNRARSPDEIKRLYKIGATLKVNTTISNDSLKKGLVGHWTFDGKDMAQHYATDASGSGNRGTLNSTTVTKTFSANASTTYAMPLGVTLATVETWGSGGGGQNLASDGGSGGGGGYSKSTINVSGGTTYVLSIGDGGAGRSGTNGVPGGDSYFANPGGTILVKACGGDGGDPSGGTPPPTGHDGGQASCGTGDVKYSGGAGGNGEDAGTGEGGGGGESGCTTGNGNPGTAGTDPGAAGGTGCDGGDGGQGGDNGLNGSVGISPGGGGGGSGEGAPVTGGAGADGQIKITYTNPDPQRVAGKIGQALEFDGVDDYVSLGNNAMSILDGENMAVAAWIKVNSTSLAIRSLLSEYSSGVCGDVLLDVDSNTAGKLSFNDGGANTITSNGTVGNGQWHHVVAVSDVSNAYIYIDGVLDKTTSDVNWNTGCTTVDVRIGARGSGGLFPFLGLIDDVRIYNRALSLNEIKRLYKIGATLKVNTTISNDSLTKGLVGHWSFDGKDISGVHAYDASGNGNRGTLTGGPVRAAGKIGQGVEFDGVNDYINASGASFTLTSATFSAWVKLDGAQDSLDGIIFSRGTDISGMDYSSGDTLGYHWNDAAATYNWTGGPSIPTRKWVFLAVTVQSDKAIAYVGSNGTITSGINTVSHSASTLSGIEIGADTPTTQYLKGLIDDVRIYNRAISADEIKWLYNAGR